MDEVVIFDIQTGGLQPWVRHSGKPFQRGEAEVYF